MRYYFKKGKNATEMQKEICAVYGEGAVTDWMSQKWFVKFCAGDFLLDDAPWLVRSWWQLNWDINWEQSELYHMEIDDILKISKSRKFLVNMKNEFYFMEKK